jgi:hypothetical protein
MVEWIKWNQDNCSAIEFIKSDKLCELIEICPNVPWRYFYKLTILQQEMSDEVYAEYICILRGPDFSRIRKNPNIAWPFDRLVMKPDFIDYAIANPNIMKEWSIGVLARITEVNLLATHNGYNNLSEFLPWSLLKDRQDINWHFASKNESVPDSAFSENYDWDWDVVSRRNIDISKIPLNRPWDWISLSRNAKIPENYIDAILNGSPSSLIPEKMIKNENISWAHKVKIIASLGYPHKLICQISSEIKDMDFVRKTDINWCWMCMG